MKSIAVLSMLGAFCLQGSALAAAPQEKAAKSSPVAVDSLITGIVDDLHTYLDMHFHKGEYNHTVNIIKMCVAADPTDIHAYVDGGHLLWSMDRDDEALALYKQGLKANPKTYFMYDELGFYYYNRKKDVPTAIKYYEQAVTFKDVTHISLHMLANCYEKVGKPDKALAMWERAAKNPEDKIARVRADRLKNKH